MGRTIQLDKKSDAANIVLVRNRIMEPHAAVDALMVRLDVRFNNASVGGLDVKSEDFCHNTRISLYRHDGKPIVRNMPIRAMEWLNQAIRMGRLKDLLDNVDTGNIATGTNHDRSYYVEVPCKLPFLERPEDGQISLAHVGRIEIAIGATGNACTVTSATAVLLADIADKRYEAKGLRQLFSMHAATALTKDEVPLGGQSLAHLLAYTKVNGTSPLTGLDGPTIKIDEQPDLIRLQTDDVTLLACYRQQPGRGEVNARSTAATPTASQTKCAILYGPPDGGPVSDLPYGNVIGLDYEAVAATAGHQFYLLHSLALESDACVRALSADGGEMTDEAFDARVDVPTVEAGVIGDRLARLLPRKIRTRNAGVGRCG